MNILLVGINGRMGQYLKNIAINAGNKIIAGIDIKNDIKNNIYNNFNINKNIIKDIDIVIDFSMPNIIDEELGFCIKNNKKLIICATGHTQDQIKLIENASKKVPIFLTANTSLGIALISKILKDNLDVINQYQVDIIEKHHINKKDAPSGTAKGFLQVLNKKANNVNCYSLRAGSVPGEHEILLFGTGEQISIKHIAESRELFAVGALRIAEFMKNITKPSLYGMEDMF